MSNCVTANIFAKGTDVAASTVANAASTQDTNTALLSPSPDSSTKSADSYSGLASDDTADPE